MFIFINGIAQLNYGLQLTPEGSTPPLGELLQYVGPLPVQGVPQRLHMGIGDGTFLGLHHSSDGKVEGIEVRIGWGPHRPRPEVSKILPAPFLRYLGLMGRGQVLLELVPALQFVASSHGFRTFLMSFMYSFVLIFKSFGNQDGGVLFPSEVMTSSKAGHLVLGLVNRRHLGDVVGQKVQVLAVPGPANNEDRPIREDLHC